MNDVIIRKKNYRKYLKNELFYVLQLGSFLCECTIAQDGLRILLNCSRDLPGENKAKHLNNLLLKTLY